MNGQMWYVAVAGQQQGPMSTDDIVGRVRAGQLDRNAHVFTQGMANWELISARPEFAAAFAAPAALPVAPPMGNAAGAPAYAAAAPAAYAQPARGAGSHEIDYEIFGQEMQFVEITLDPGEQVVAEAGAFMYMDPGINMETIFGDGSAQSGGGGLMGKLMQAGKRVLTGESLFMTVFTNTGGGRQKVAFASPYPGSIVPLDLRELGGTILCQKDAFLCAARGTAVGIAFQRKLGVGLFGGEGFILEKLEGDGKAFVHAGGCIIERELRAGETMRLDTGCLVAFQPSVNYDIQAVPGIKTALFGGEGIFFAALTGPGKVWIQSLPFARLASRVWANAPKGGGKGSDEGSLLGGIGNLMMGD
jgi:uncharacterized protein (TIGR00266 family)